MNSVTNTPRVSATAPPVATLVHTARRRPDTVDPLAVYACSQATDRIFWASRDGGPTFAAIGVAADLVADTATTGSAFRAIARSRVALGARLRAAGPDGPAPVLLGGFAFDHDPAGADPRWRRFPAGRLVLPELLVIRRPDGEVWSVTTAAADAASDAHERADALLAEAGRWRPADRRPPAVADAELDSAAYPALVARGLQAIADDTLEKVVLARAVDLPIEVDVATLLAALRDRYPTCAVFGFTSGPSTFLGATPELLVRVGGDRVETDALAASRPRHPDPDQDAALGRELLTDPKELAEHRYVVEALRRTLLGAGVVLDERPEPALRVLPGIQHLLTPVRGRMTSTATSTVALASRLHPSPAVGGTPAPAAARFIREHESLDRGWYAGPVGWVGLEGRGEFHVALRSGLVDDAGLRLFAGAGIVAGSDPERELAETTIKLRAVLDALTSGPHGRRGGAP